MAADGAAAVVLALYDGPLRTRLVGRLRDACAEHDLRVVEALHVDGGRWRSYTCSGPCCPPEGTPLPVDSAALRLVAAERTAAGRAVLASRADLAASVAPPDGDALARARRQVGEARRTAARERQTGGPRARQDARRRAADLLDRVRDGGSVTGAEAAALAVCLDDVAVRDELATRLLDRSDELLALLLQAVRLVPAEGSAPLCAVLAWVAWSRGDGALANVALDRALADDPAYSLGTLLRAGLDAGLPPADVRAVAARAAEALRSDRPDSGDD